MFAILMTGEQSHSPSDFILPRGRLCHSVALKTCIPSMASCPIPEGIYSSSPATFGSQHTGAYSSVCSSATSSALSSKP